jgi:hypothetical protein
MNQKILLGQVSVQDVAMFQDRAPEQKAGHFREQHRGEKGMGFKNIFENNSFF